MLCVQNCQILLGAIYQNVKNAPNDHKIYRMDITYTNQLQNIPNGLEIYYNFQLQSLSQYIFQNCYFLVWQYTNCIPMYVHRKSRHNFVEMYWFAKKRIGLHMYILTCVWQIHKINRFFKIWGAPLCLNGRENKQINKRSRIRTQPRASPRMHFW
jgi:hypothetical protein